MKIDVCDVCLTKNKLTKTKIKGQTALHGTRLSLCRSLVCKSVWKKINNNKIAIVNLLNESEKNLEVLMK